MLKFVFIIAFLCFLMFIINTLLKKLYSDFEFGFFLASLFFVLFWVYFVFHLAYFFGFYFKYIEINNNNISIFELYKLKTRKSKFGEIMGYSKSEVYFGKNLWKSKSIVIYFNNGETSEILNIFISNLSLFEEELKRKKIKYLGFEGYQTGWFYREYNFNKVKK